MKACMTHDTTLRLERMLYGIFLQGVAVPNHLVIYPPFFGGKEGVLGKPPTICRFKSDGLLPDSTVAKELFHILQSCFLTLPFDHPEQ